MARNETIFTVFLASPSDVEEERGRVERVIDELNVTWSRSLGIRLELIKWESHAYPGFGTDGQAVINDQIPQDYDLFIGIMWSRFGSATIRAGSGTEEEFRQAKDRYDADNTSVQLMMYFKDAPPPISMSDLDLEQLAKVLSFRRSVAEQGGLIWKFKTADEFQTQVRLHLTRYVQQWVIKDDSPISISKVPDKPMTDRNLEDMDDDDVGLLDLMETIEDEFSALNEIAEQVANATESFGETLGERNYEIQKLQKDGDTTNVRTVKRLLTKVSGDMDTYAHRMESEIPVFAHHLQRGMEAITQVTALLLEFNADEQDIMQLHENVDQLREIRGTLGSTGASLQDFLQSINGFPRMTSELNRSKRTVARAIQSLIGEIASAEGMAGEAEVSLAAMVKSKS